MPLLKDFLFLIIMMLVGFDLFAAENKNEKWYVDNYCYGEKEVVLKDRTRVDCLTMTHAYEFDFAQDWAESIGQCLNYARMTDRFPGIYMIYRTHREFILHSPKIRGNVGHYNDLQINLIEILDF